jgi:hypothetical protein
VQEVIERYELARRVPALAVGVELLNPGEQALVELVAADGVVDAVALLEQPRQDLVDVRDRERVVGAEGVHGAFRSRARPVPKLALRIALAAKEQKLPLLPPGHEHGDGVRLGKAGQIVEVAVRPVVV